MGVAALILGILGLIIAWIPLCGMVALLPCVIGLCLGIADIVVKSKREQPRGVGIAGTILNAVALAILIIWNVYIAAQIANDPEFSTALSSNYRHSPDCLSALSQYSTAPIAAEPASAPQALPAPYPSSASCQTQPAPASQPQQPAGASRKKRAPKTPQSSIMDEVIARFLEE